MASDVPVPPTDTPLPETGSGDASPPGAQDDGRLEGGAYEIIRQRLTTAGQALRDRLDRLNAARKEIFGAIDLALTATERITTRHNCVPRDMIAIPGGRFLFGYNVFMGLKSQVEIEDVFSVYERRDGSFHALPPEFLDSGRFAEDLRNLYKYYRKTEFAKFSVMGPHLFMVFRVGQGVNDIKTFKWLPSDTGLTYLDNRSDHELKCPPQHDFQWTRTTRDDHRQGKHPHVSIQDRVFVEAVGGDITFKVENNTESGRGVYSEPVENADQTLDDAEISYALLGPLILVRIKPYQETAHRHFIFNKKTQGVFRADEIATACVRLPEDHGLIFSNGYCLSTGEFKRFDASLSGLRFENRVASPNGEDFLYVFFHPESGGYQLLSYDLIEHVVATPLPCQGFSLFPSGEMILFRADTEPVRHHAIQIWRTPYVSGDHALPGASDAFLYKVGNPPIVRFLSECREILRLIGRDEPYASLYIDLMRKASAVADAYFWIGEADAFSPKEILLDIKAAASAAIEEYAKVTRMRRHAADSLAGVAEKAKELLRSLSGEPPEDIDAFVSALNGLRAARGEAIALKELRYADAAAIDRLDADLAQAAEEIGRQCVNFLKSEKALSPYAARVTQTDARVAAVSRATEADALESEIHQTASDLEMLIQIVGNLKIDDPTETTRVIEAISGHYARLNGTRSRLRARRKELAGIEGKAQFAAQVKLLEQSVTNYLDVADAPEKCDEFLTRVMVNLEELEGRFSEFDDFVPVLAEKRAEIHAAFESRKLSLVEARNRRAGALLQSGERILAGVKNRLAGMNDISAIQAYFASDLMIEKIRGIIAQLSDLGDGVKADDLRTRLKTAREDAARQLKDRQELQAGGAHLIRFGAHTFTVNTQPLDLTLVFRDGRPHLHLTGTGFFELVEDPAFEDTRPVWDMEAISENRDVYRAEYLAFRMLRAAEAGDIVPPPPSDAGQREAALLDMTRTFMAPRYAEGYTRGVHDGDGARIFAALWDIHSAVGPLAASPPARTLARLFWSLDFQETDGQAQREFWAGKIAAFGRIQKFFHRAGARESDVAALAERITAFLRNTGLFPEELAPEAARFLFGILAAEMPGDPFPASRPAWDLAQAVIQHLKAVHAWDRFEEARNRLTSHPAAEFEMIRDTVTAFRESVASGDGGTGDGGTGADGTGDGGAGDGGAVPFADLAEFTDEAAILIFERVNHPKSVARFPLTMNITGLSGSHPLISGGTLRFHYLRFMERLRRHDAETVPRFQRFQELKQAIVAAGRERLRLSEYQPRVLTSFVRNRLIDQVYLPLIGDNLAKQIGTADDSTRTDRMGMLLLISPPGYGKTTIMEYIANRLGIIFMKINGPSIGHRVMSLDPAEAPNASAREEVDKINLALEMGDNVMIYLDDIQHCNPELLQKFISLCDAQRRIEGVRGGKSRTYDLRGKKVAVVMAGNPYTESGEKFRVPDMLANRADTYNLGDIIGDTADVFKLSYLENAVTSNPALNPLASRSQKDVLAVIAVAETGSREGVEFEGNYGAEELAEMVAVMKRLVAVRDVILKVNLAYIASAAQADAYRVEPPFLLQGSYRNMNRIAGKISAVMTPAETRTLILSHYENESQTLTTGAEANLLKFKELMGWLSESEAKRWEDIRHTFRKNQLLHGLDASNPVSQVVAQLSGFQDGLSGIQRALASGLEKPDKGAVRVSFDSEGLGPLTEMVAALRNVTDRPAAPAFPEKLTVESTLPAPFLKLLKAQFDAMKSWTETLLTSGAARGEELAGLAGEIRDMREVYREILNAREDGDWRAIERLSVQLKANPKDHESYYKRGLALYNQGETLRALSDFKNALDIEPKNKKYQRIVAHLEAELTTDRGE